MSAQLAQSSSEILRKIGCPQLKLYRCVGQGYWYFVFDALDDGGAYESESVYVPRLNDMTYQQWVEIGVRLVKQCGGSLR